MNIRLVAVVLLTILTAGACDGSPDSGGPPARTPIPTPTSADALVIGLVGTMTGPDSWRGEDAFEGADLGVHILNRNLPEKGEGNRFELATLDDAGDPAKALQAIRNLAASKRTIGIVYAGPPEAVPDSEEVLARAGIPLLLTYGDLYTPRKLTHHVFQVSPPYLWQARRLAAYLTRDRAYEQVGALVESSFSGDAALAALKSALGPRGARLATVRYSPDPKDLRPVLQRLRSRHVEAVVVQGSPTIYSGVTTELQELGARYRSTPTARIASAPGRVRRTRLRTGHWRPQVLGFDSAIAARGRRMASGSVAADTYARGAHYLPIPSFRSFRRAFADWWDLEPLGWERRSFEAAQMIGWAATHLEPRDDIVRSIERLRNVRFGGLPITLGPDDHTAVEQTDVGLWVVPFASDRVRERSRIERRLEWVPLARGFSIDGQTSDIHTDDWRYLFRRPPPRGGPAPRLTTMRFGVSTRRSDTRH